MRIIIDVRPYQSGHAKRGIGKFLMGALPELIDQAVGDEVVLVSWRGISLPKELTKHRSVSVETVGNKLISLADRISFRYLGRHIPYSFIAHVKGDVLLQPDIAFGLSRSIPTAVVFYDVIPLLFPKEYLQTSRSDGSSKVDPRRKNRYMRELHTYLCAQHIISISVASLHGLHKSLPRSKNIPATVALLAAQTLPVPTKPASIGYAYLLYVGGNDHRKNVTELLHIFEGIAKKKVLSELRLVLVGYDFDVAKRPLNPEFWQAYDVSPVKDRIVLEGYASESRLASLYLDCEAYINPSLYEGFGLTVLEAMAAGAPVVSYDNSSIPEVAGQAALLVKTKEEMSRAIQKLLSDKTVGQRLQKLGSDQARQFTWKRTAIAMYAALKATAKTRNEYF